VRVSEGCSALLKRKLLADLTSRPHGARLPNRKSKRSWIAWRDDKLSVADNLECGSDIGRHGASGGWQAIDELGGAEHQPY
jgi:hypothetical protein